MISLSLTKQFYEHSFDVYYECNGTLHCLFIGFKNDKEIMPFCNTKILPVCTKNIAPNFYCKVRNEYGSHYRNLSLGIAQ